MSREEEDCAMPHEEQDEIRFSSSAMVEQQWPFYGAERVFFLERKQVGESTYKWACFDTCFALLPSACSLRSR